MAIAVTCVGGPKPDEDGNPAGLAYLAVQLRNGRRYQRRLQMDEHSSGRIRGEVLLQALQLALEAMDQAA
jgi:nicotinamide mononucleotide (NMN) deamidase PncC